MSEKQNAPSSTKPEASQEVHHGSSQDIPSLACRCPRMGDLWQCAGRPGLICDLDGRRCELGGLSALGSDHDVRGELAEMLARGENRG